MLVVGTCGGLLSGHTRVEVINASDPGTNTVQQLMILKDKGLQYQPDMILLIYNLNDIQFRPKLSQIKYDGLAVPVVQLRAREEVTKFSENKGIRGMIRKIEEHSAFTRFLVPRVGHLLRKGGLLSSIEFSWVAKLFEGFNEDNPGWLESKRALKEIAEISKRENMVFIVAIYPLLVELDNYKGKKAHGTIMNFCKTIQIFCVDLLGVFENTNAQSYWINFADAHPNAIAHHRVAEFLLSDVERYTKNYHGSKQ